MDILQTVLKYNNHVKPEGMDFSVSELTGSSDYQLWLAKNKVQKTYQNPLQNSIPSIVGTGFHMFSEEALKEHKELILEKLLIGTICGLNISGTPDIVFKRDNRWIIGDFKTKGTFKMKESLMNNAEDVVGQLSLYAYLFSQVNNEPMAEHGEVYLVHMGDTGWFSKANCLKLGLPPKSKVPKYATVPVDLWSKEEVEVFVKEKMLDIQQEPLVDCCVEWARCSYCEYDCKERL